MFDCCYSDVVVSKELSAEVSLSVFDSAELSSAEADDVPDSSVDEVSSSFVIFSLS